MIISFLETTTARITNAGATTNPVSTIDINTKPYFPASTTASPVSVHLVSINSTLTTETSTFSVQTTLHSETIPAAPTSAEAIVTTKTTTDKVLLVSTAMTIPAATTVVTETLPAQAASEETIVTTDATTHETRSVQTALPTEVATTQTTETQTTSLRTGWSTGFAAVSTMRGCWFYYKSIQRTLFPYF